ncbi:4-hydroxy-tetrahydrodipicolinate synthase [Lentilactobacillus sp. TOM.63]|uniref:4-hydroxy-tetrahydrodipicolinate synthase n=1 Tax=Lentilactobacillus TaxID=2767893 RepID=UPI001C273BC8|nr:MULTISPECIES: 4-hydroxy-tetrahydrodipicolinate synthase [Lentilactobacillus]MBU9790106.1 4-hydroxy-tetrahydrodipicolinate synthase [Lentilactobacillus dabitei]MDM7516405.1 4-hydroxy-tetrahydrodipicolinate synthase [Lentilactobacillus sp. TOM.63]
MINADIMTAIITPFGDDGTINFDALERLTNHCIETGSKGFVIGGTTGETPTLSHDEKIELYTRFAKIVAGRGTIIAGTGSNNTRQTTEFTAEVSQIPGIDYALVVVPYYNKPNQRGMVAHFTTVAAQSAVPIIMYNIPGRTGVTMTTDTIVALSSNPNIAGVKQCGSMADLEYLVQNVAQGFNVYTGEDAQALFAKTVGANGVISVASHIYGSEMREMYDDLASGNVDAAGKLMRDLTPKMAALFMYPSPSPVKAVLNANGYGVGDCRLPILSLNDEEEAKLATALGVAQLSDIPFDKARV